MNNDTERQWRPTVRAALGVTALLGGLSALPAHAQSEGGGIKWTVDGELSQGFLWRAEGRNRDLIGAFRGGLGGPGGDAIDDGNLNYDKGDLASAPLVFIGTAEVEWRNQRVLLRARLLEDWKIMDRWRHHGGQANESVLRDDVRDAVARRAEILDAYWAGGFATGADSHLELKLGRQTIVWGEAAFIPGGINQFNPLDISRLRQPGATLKDGMLPIGAAAATWRANSALTLQGFYQLGRARMRLDPVGTLFSDIDFFTEGAGTVSISTVPPSVVTRRRDGELKKDGQYGVATFFNLPGWGVGAYYQNLHARTPKVSGIGRGANQPFPFAVSETSYFLEYPQDIQTLGLSFNTAAGPAALRGEIALRRNVPIPLDATATALARANAMLCGAIAGLPSNCAGLGIPLPFLIPGVPLVADANGYVKGWTTAPQVNVNLGMTLNFTGSDRLTRALRADGGMLMLEAGLLHTRLPDQRTTPTLVADKWHGTLFGLLQLDYLNVGGSGWTITPKLIGKTYLFGDSPDGAPFHKRRREITPAIQFHHDQKPDLSVEVSYTRVSDHGSRGQHVLADRDFIAATAKWTF